MCKENFTCIFLITKKIKVSLFFIHVFVCTVIKFEKKLRYYDTTIH